MSSTSSSEAGNPEFSAEHPTEASAFGWPYTLVITLLIELFENTRSEAFT